MAVLPTDRTTANTALEHVGDHNELHDGHNLSETHRARTDNPHGVTKSQVGLADADNTSDASKPVSTATQAALDAKQPLDADLTTIAALDPTTAGALATDGAGWIRKTYAQLKTALGLVKADVGLGSVDNTSDTDKPVSTAQQTALDSKETPAGAQAKADAAETDANAYTDSRVVKAVIDALGIDAATLEGLTVAEIQTQITAAIVDASPATLDTLNELAAALGDDPNFATTILDAIAVVQTDVNTHEARTDNPHSVTKAQVGLANADNTSDANKPISTATQAALDAKAPVGSPEPRWTATRYYSPIGSRRTIAHGLNLMTCSPIWVPRNRSIDRIGCEVTTAVASAVARLGIYRDTGNGMPGALLLDAGTIDASTTGAKEITISQALTEPLYWLALVSQVASATFRGISGVSDIPNGGQSLAVVTTDPISGVYQSGVSGALPASFASTTGTSSPYLLAVRAA